LQQLESYVVTNKQETPRECLVVYLVLVCSFFGLFLSLMAREKFAGHLPSCTYSLVAKDLSRRRKVHITSTIYYLRYSEG